MRSTTPTGATRHPPTERARPLSASPAGRHWALGGGWAPVEDEVAGDDVEPRERAPGGGVDHDRSLWAATRSAPTHRLWRYGLARRSPPPPRAVSRREAAADEHGGRGQPGEDDADARHAHLGPAYSSPTPFSPALDNGGREKWRRRESNPRPRSPGTNVYKHVPRLDLARCLSRGQYEHRASLTQGLRRLQRRSVAGQAR